MIIDLPYGEWTVPASVPDENLLAVLEAPEIRGAADPTTLIANALDDPIECPSLQDLARPGQRVAIATSDASRPNVERHIVPLLLEWLVAAGIRPSDVTFVIGNGFHRYATGEELEAMLGPALAAGAQVENHSALRSGLVRLGRTSQGIPAVVNSAFVNADLRIAIGTVLPHPFAGFSGAGKAISVGIAGAETIAATHTAFTLEHPMTGLGMIDGNPMYLASLEVARLAGLHFLINATVDPQGRIVDVVAGEVEKAHRRLVERSARHMFQVPLPEAADIVIVSAGHPKDGNLYHVVAEGVCIAAGDAVPQACVKPGGTIIAVSPMEEGIYNTVFFDYYRECGTPQEVVRRAKEEGVTLPGQHRAFGLAKVMLDHEVAVAEFRCEQEIFPPLGIRSFGRVSEALDYAFRRHGAPAKVTVLKNSHRLIPVPKQHLQDGSLRAAKEELS